MLAWFRTDESGYFPLEGRALSIASAKRLKQKKFLEAKER
jgi:hypothetical protein